MANIEQYRGMLKVNKHRLDDELEVQAEIQDRIAQQVVAANTRQLEAKDRLARVEARLLEDFKEDEAKMTEKLISAKIIRHKERLDAWERFQAMRAEYEDWNNLQHEWEKRGYSLRGLIDLYGAQYFSLSSTNAPRAMSYDDRRARVRRDDGESRGDRASRTALDSIAELGVEPRQGRARERVSLS